MEFGSNLSDGPIDLHDDVREQAAAAASTKFFRHVKRYVDHRMRHVQKERTVSILTDEVDGPVRVASRKRCLIVAGHVGIDNAIILDQGEGGIVVLCAGDSGGKFTKLG